MIEIYFKTIRDAEFKKIEEIRPGCWIHVSEPTSKDLQRITDLTELDLSDLKDSLDIHEIPRVDHDDDNIIIFTRHPSDHEEGLYTTTLTIILTKMHIITISPKPSRLIENISGSIIQLGTTQKSKLLFHILLKITQDFTNQIRRVRYNVLKLEKEIQHVSDNTISFLTKSEEALNQHLTSLVPMRNVLESIEKGRFVHLFEEDKDLIEDLMLAIRQSEDLCRVNVKSIRSLRDSYQILFTNDVNRTIKRLTAITIIFTIPTIIASVYGMNVALPFEKNPFAFWIVMNMIMITTLVSVIVFAKKRWL